MFRGRYGAGANKLNLAKNGVLLSTRNALGSFNWIKPNRSSSTLFSIHVRGQKAANLQIACMLSHVVMTFLELTVMLALLMIQWLHVVTLWIANFLRELSFIARQALWRYRVWRRRGQLRMLSTAVDSPAPNSEAALSGANASTPEPDKTPVV